MPEERYKWDFFLAHAGVDLSAAEQFYVLLEPHSKVFLDSRCLILGDDWDQELAAAQSNSLVSVVLVSSRTDNAYIPGFESSNKVSPRHYELWLGADFSPPRPKDVQPKPVQQKSVKQSGVRK